ncbi:MAG: MMPL family transporter [Candidatus Heimdallarchaeaceae archaeon]
MKKNNNKKNNNKKNGKSAFGKLAEITEKYRWFILITWIILAAVAAPFAMNIGDKLETDETAFLGETPAGQGLTILGDKFPEYSSSFVAVIDGLEESDLTLQNFTDFMTSLKNTLEDESAYPYIDSVLSIYSILEELQTFYNVTLEEVQTFLNVTFTEQIPLMYDYIGIANETTKGLIDLLEQVPLYYLFAWSDFSKFIYYTNNQTSAYSNGFFNSTEYVLMNNWTMFDNTTLDMYLMSTLPLAPVIPLMQADPYFADNMTSVLAFQAVNASMSAMYNESEYGIPYLNSLSYNYLLLVNATFDPIRLSSFFPQNAFFDDYYATSNPVLTDFQQGMLSQLNVIGNLTTLKPIMKTQSGQLLVNMLPPGSEEQLLFQMAYNLREEDYETSIIYKQTLISSITQAVNASFSTLLENFTISGFDFDPAMFFDEFDVEGMITSLYETPSFMIGFVTTMMIQQVSLLVNQKMNEIMPYPTIITELPEDIYYGLISSDNSTMIVSIFLKEVDESVDLEDFTPVLRDNIEVIKIDSGVTVDIYVTGTIALMYDLKDVMSSDLATTDVTTILFVLGVLVIVFLSPFTPFVPLIAIGLGIMIVNAIFLLMSNFITMSSYTVIITSVVMMGAGVDYCIFMIFRYKEQRRKGDSKEKAVVETTKKIGESVLTSGLTVMIGFGALMFSKFSMLQLMGLGPIFGIAISLLLALTFIPVILHLLGDKIYWPRMGRNGKKDKKKEKKEVDERKPEKSNPLLEKMTHFTLNNPLVVIGLFLLLSSPFVYFGVTGEQSYDITATLPSTIDSVAGSNILAEEFVIGELQPITVLLVWNESLTLNETTGLPEEAKLIALENVISHILTDYDNVTDVNTITRPNGEYIPPEMIDNIHLEQMHRYISADNTTIMLMIYLEVDPFGKEALDVAHDLITNLGTDISAELVLQDAVIFITGMTALYSELNTMMIEDTPIILIVTVVGIFLVLFFLLGSVFTPIRLELTILLSVFISLGATNLVFHHGFNQPIIWFLPVMLFVIMFGLGMDFDILLVSRIKEEIQKGATDKEATFIAVKSTSRMILSAGLIMSASFFSLMLSQLWPLRIIGFAIGLAVLIDATLIRLFLVPALMMVLKKLNWWPYLRISKETVMKNYARDNNKKD